MPIDDLARSDVVTADPGTAVTDLARTMADEDAGSVVITDEDEPTGIVTDRDLTVRVLGEALDPTDQTAADVMSEDLATVDAGVGFYEDVERMADDRIRRVPVVEGGSLVGIITGDDVTAPGRRRTASREHHPGAAHRILSTRFRRFPRPSGLILR